MLHKCFSQILFLYVMIICCCWFWLAFSLGNIVKDLLLTFGQACQSVSFWVINITEGHRLVNVFFLFYSFIATVTR
jgi:hypothetical protein